MLSIQNITKNFGGIRALQGASFDIEKGKITAIIGPNGAGKTTLFDVASGLIKPDTGEITLDLSRSSTTLPRLGEGLSEDVAKLTGERSRLISLTHSLPYRIANLGIARTFQQVRLFKNLTILDHLIMAETNEDTKLLRNLLQISDFRLQNEKYEKRLIEFGVEKPLNTLVSDLSYGQRKLLQLLIAVLRPHQILLLDEPVAGVNKVVAAKIESLLLDLKQKGETIIIIDHDMEFIRGLADKVVCMDEGRVLLEGQPEEVLKDKRVMEAYLGE